MREKRPVEALIAAADEAINREDVDAVLEFYAEHAVLVVRPGVFAVGKDNIRRAFVAIAVHFEHALTFEQLNMEVLESGDTALVIAVTRISAKGMTPVDRKAIYAFERGRNGCLWRIVVQAATGNSYSPRQ